MVSSVLMDFNFSAKLKAERSVHEYYDAAQRSSSLNSGIDELWSLMSLSLVFSDMCFLVYIKKLSHNMPFF